MPGATQFGKEGLQILVVKYMTNEIQLLFERFYLMDDDPTIMAREASQRYRCTIITPSVTIDATVCILQDT